MVFVFHAIIVTDVRHTRIANALDRGTLARTAVASSALALRTVASMAFRDVGFAVRVIEQALIETFYGHLMFHG